VKGLFLSSISFSHLKIYILSGVIPAIDIEGVYIPGVTIPGVIVGVIPPKFVGVYAPLTKGVLSSHLDFYALFGVGVSPNLPGVGSIIPLPGVGVSPIYLLGVASFASPRGVISHLVFL